MERLNRLITPLTVFCLCSFIAVTGQGEVVGIGTGTAVAPEEVKDYYIDPVCSREVNKDTPHTREVDGKIYYFCSEACKRAFKKEMVETPGIKLIYIDPVCGCRVDEDAPHVAKYKGTTYYFCIRPCRNRFLASPELFSCYCVEGEHCPHRESRPGEPCEQGSILGWGRWSHWGCPIHMDKSDFSY
ncbi:MAG: hypothetical protein A3G17_01510 [Planctomycetes bacterium RIFCSPLOWO2_12_FULL_50_35]|nr:MAG: hypothetical protein A3I59_04645 [Planctomycetes bacterium RIFCSPLOWO2_02_FULL_50_16]OHC03093.1 MAG: hypothetical protein A3G17_01510 [Planctomycetes bacterium RIFCSPLOWO2_12_FULL_50_35]